MSWTRCRCVIYNCRKTFPAGQFPGRTSLLFRFVLRTFPSSVSSLAIRRRLAYTSTFITPVGSGKTNAEQKNARRQIQVTSFKMYSRIKANSERAQRRNMGLVSPSVRPSVRLPACLLRAPNSRTKRRRKKSKSLGTFHMARVITGVPISV